MAKAGQIAVAQIVAKDNHKVRLPRRHANAMAAQLAEGIAGLDGLETVMPVETNAVFVRLPLTDAAALQQTHVFAVWDSRASIVRWMTAFDTSPDDVDAFVRRITEVVRKG